MNLTPDERYILTHLTLSHKQQARQLGWTLSKVKHRRQVLFDKLGLPRPRPRGRTGVLATLAALRLGVVRPEDLSVGDGAGEWSPTSF